MKKLLIVIFFCWITVAVYGQQRPSLAILPFTGGRAADGETLAELFSFDQTLNGAFTPVPRTSINNAIRQEQNFQMESGMTDPETIARLGHQLGARFIVAGSITRIGSQNLLVIAIMRIDNLQQIAGEWLAYDDISEVRSRLPAMAKNIVEAAQKNTSRLQRLAILPFQMTAGDREGDAFAQVLAAEIIKTGTYAVFPRTRTLEQVQAEYRTQLSGDTADEYAISIGQGDNPLLALSGAARRLGQERMFNAAIINVESGVQIKGESVDYQYVEDGIEAIKTLGVKLSTGVTTGTNDFRVSNLAELRNAIDTINRRGAGNYTITLFEDITIGPNDRDIKFPDNVKNTVTLTGYGKQRSINSQRNSPILDITSDLFLVLGSNIRLRSNHGVVVRNGGTLRIESGALIADSFRGVEVGKGGTLTMSGGTISGNRDAGVYSHSTFTMSGGTISGNGKAGVSVYDGSFTMSGGTISDNSERGVEVMNASFTMTGGTIINNKSNGVGHGVSLYNSTFVKTGGTISAKNIPVNQQITVVVSTNNSSLFRRSTAGPSVRLDSRVAGAAGGWEP